MTEKAMILSGLSEKRSLPEQKTPVLYMVENSNLFQHRSCTIHEAEVSVPTEAMSMSTAMAFHGPATISRRKC